ncbi:hypothetical protein ACFL27_27445 [candidate division CSSED10-310 bacterium]|uniref:Uncharacterized protein n=1 Tax=candidate division CSSED10-310 bacterium TaxID=2855610 RepID=A0ABV6Z6F1_UNCC1
MPENNDSLINNEEHRKKNRIAQWVFDTLPVLNRFHLWLKDVKAESIRGEHIEEDSFLGISLCRSLVMSAAVTALGTRLFGRFGEGAGQDKMTINQVKKDADAISAYAMSEGLWHLSRTLPENHAILISIGEGLLPKAGETPDMGANPLLGYGRIYARPQVARFLEVRVNRLINDPQYSWNNFYQEVQEEGITIWGSAVDTLENTNRFAMGADTGPITVFHIFDQPLMLTIPYEGYIGSLLLPHEVVDQAEDQSILINVNTPREKVVEAIKHTYKDIKNDHIHVWTLRGKTREKRIGSLWQEWEKLGVHVVNDGDLLSTGKQAFTSSGTYAPTFSVGDWKDDQGNTHVFIVDGYAASAEAVQGATLSAMLDVDCSLIMFSPRFKLSHEKEKLLMRLDPAAPDFEEKLTALLAERMDVTPDMIEEFRVLIKEAALAGFPLGKKAFHVNDLFPKKFWDGTALIGYMLDDPYTGESGVQQLSDNTFRVSVRLVTPKGINRYDIDLEMRDEAREFKKIFNPLLDRFVAGEDYHERPVKKSDSGRIRNELQTLISQALEYSDTDDKIKVKFSLLDDLTMPAKKKEDIREILHWFRQHHPIWFRWLEIED